VVGETDKTAPVREALSSIQVRIRELAGFPEVDQALGTTTVGIVLVEPPQAALIEEAAGIAAHRPTVSVLPIFVVVPDATTDSQVARLYRSGATCVFAWPLESAVIATLLREILGVELRSSKPSDADRALQRAIRTRLRVVGKDEKGLRISTRDGAVSLSGTVDRLWKKRALEDAIAQVPGVRMLAADRLEVVQSGVPDREVANAVRSLLRGASSIDQETLAVSVHDGFVVVVGTVLNREEWLHTLELLSMLEGVRSVINRTEVSSRKKKQIRGHALRLKRSLEVLLTDAAEVEVAVVGEVGVLRGRTPSLSVKREAEAILLRDPGIERVVNKIEVEP
jgi:osmotically-inducible protein OsmY